MKVRSRSLIFGAVLCGFSSAAFAQCAGFSDVPSGTAACQNVLWLKNRGITLGCEDGSIFCPNQPVTRLQMAAFMNRSGNVLTPQVRSVEQAGNSLALATENRVCETPVLPGVIYERDVHADGSLSWDANVASELLLTVVYSLDNGATWQATPLNDQPVSAATQPGARRHASVTLKREALPSANGSADAIRFAMRVQSVPASGQLTSFACNLQVVVTSARE